MCCCVAKLQHPVLPGMAHGGHSAFTACLCIVLACCRQLGRIGGLFKVFSWRDFLDGFVHAGSRPGCSGQRHSGCLCVWLEVDQCTLFAQHSQLGRIAGLSRMPGCSRLLDGFVHADFRPRVFRTVPQQLSVFPAWSWVAWQAASPQASCPTSWLLALLRMGAAWSARVSR